MKEQSIKKYIDSDGISRIKAEGTRNSFWAKYTNSEKGYTLEKREFGKPLKIYGWFEEVSFGKNKGKLEAVIPTYPDEDGNDCIVLGYYDSEEECIDVILRKNHPDYGGVFI